MPLSGGDRKALTKELSKSRAMTRIFAERSAEKRQQGEALIREADNHSGLRSASVIALCSGRTLNLISQGSSGPHRGL